MRRCFHTRNYSSFTSLCMIGSVETSLEQLYTEHVRALYRYAVGLTGNIDEANDIVQTVFTRLASRENPMPRAVTKTYLFAAVRNGARDYWKRKQPIPFSHMMDADDIEREVPDDASGLLEQAEQASELSVVLSAFPLLTEEQREVLSLKYFSGLSTAEIAAEM